MRFLFVDKILALIPGERVSGIKHVTADDYYLTSDSHGKPCFATSLIGETLGQLAAWNVMSTNNFSQRPVAGVVAEARLHRPVYVGETILLESFIDCLDDSAVQYHSKASVGEDTVFTVEGALGPLLPMDMFIDDTTVRQQFNDIMLSANPSLRATTKQSNAPISLFQYDEVIACTPGESLHAVKHVAHNAPYFPDHFPNRPVLPMTILLECKLHLANIFLQASNYAIPYQIEALRKIKMNEFVSPGDSVHTYVNVQKRDEEQLTLRYRSEVNGKRVCVLDILLQAKGCNHE